MFEKFNSKNVVIVNSQGEIIYFSENNMPVYDLDPENTIGNKVTHLYKNLDRNNSSMIASIKTGKSFVDLKQGLKTQHDNLVYQVGSTYPLMDKNIIIGAIEFAEIVNPHSPFNRFLQPDMVYKKNGTCYTIDDIITVCPQMQNIKKRIHQSSMTDSTVLIQGNTGTGKELVAQAIHNCSNRRDGPFVSQNCGAIPENLFESILFGTTKGSYTGAENKEGLFEMAKGGTLFLDEINSLNTFSQIKLLKAIEEKRIRRIGGSQDIYLDIRIIVASNEKTDKLIEEGRLRNDLYYRLSVVNIILPDLKDRAGDIEYLSNYFIEYYNHRFGFNIKPISNDILDIFNAYHWPGNIRELRNVIEGIFNSISKDYITEKDLPERILKDRRMSVMESAKDKDFDLLEYLKSHEKNIVLETYRKHQNNLMLTAQSLNISKQLLRYKLDKYNK